MNKKLAIIILSISFSGLFARPSEGPKKYAFALVQQAEERFEKKLSFLKKELKEKIEAFESAMDMDGFVKLSKEDILRLKFLLKNVISYR